ncbi:C10 family peptidase [candidate division WOR-3 bacterium]|nr:C10 family peptidase [candidate division WOR-3 bacterium]
MKTASLIIVLVSFCVCLNADFVDHSVASSAAFSKLAQDGQQDSRVIVSSFALSGSSASETLAYVFELNPTGYIIVTADDDLFPVIAYSYEDRCRTCEETSNVLFELIVADLELKLSNFDQIPASVISGFKGQWRDLLDGKSYPYFEQWPPSGTTPTGGWLMSNWTQNSPYNSMCPIDPQTGQRSIAGCPAVAMGMIVNYQENINSTQFSDADDYYHSYAGRNFWIDNDWADRGFPSWSQLNVYLDTLGNHYLSGTPLTNQDKGALVWACGAAMEQVYTSSGSGTFGATQAYNAYVKFGYGDLTPLDTLSDSLYERLSQNMKDAMPAHITALTPPPIQGHNFVIDGYNTNDYYHLNMGWGGTYNGWYIIPDSIPYNLTVIDTIFIDIGESPNSIEEPIVRPIFAEFSGKSSFVFHSSPSVIFSLPQSCDAEIRIFDLTGRTACPAERIHFEKGVNSYDVSPGYLGSGIYVFKLSAGGVDSFFRFTVID